MSKVIGHKTPPSIKRAVAAKVKESGELATARDFGISRNTVVRLLSGLPMQKGTLALVAQRLGVTS